MNRDASGAVWKGAGDWNFCPCGVGVHHPPSVDVFTNLEALPTPCFRDFYGGFLTPFLALL